MITTETLAPDVAAEIDGIEQEIIRFRRGEISPERFRAFRLVHGLYGQRQPDVHMVRVKVPGGVLTGRQLEALASASEEFSTGIAHLTTRQDVQFHYVPLERTPDLLRHLAAAGLTTREACGNSVRNVTACPLTGALANEAFDVRPFTEATFAYLVRSPFCQQMARKFKIAFSACPEDCAATAIHDIGALGRLEPGPRGPRAGFTLLAGGGLGPVPFVAQVVSPFVPAADLLPMVRAILTVFAEHGNRRQRTMARLKFVVSRLGITRFRDLVLLALAAQTPAERAEARLLDYVAADDVETVRRLIEDGPVSAPVGLAASGAKAAAPVAPAPGPGSGPGREAREEFAAWTAAAVRAHRDPERAIVTVTVPIGDLRSPVLRRLADAAERMGDGQVRVTREQNLVFPSVPRAGLAMFHATLRAVGLAETGAGTALDVTSCPGADTCALGITSSKGVARAVRRELLPLAGNGGAAALAGVTIKVSGCPNACGQHHVAAIGLHGVVKTIKGVKVPAYQIHLGGTTGQGQARIGRALEKVPARNVPKAIRALLEVYGAERTGDVTFADFAAALPAARVTEILKPHVETLPPEEERVFDWEQKVPFSTDDLGTGECAGAGVDAVVDPFDNVRVELKQAALFAERGMWSDALATINRSQYTAARVLLEALGRRLDSDYEVGCELRARVIDRGYAGEGWNDLHREIEELLRARRPSPIRVRGVQALAATVLAEFAGVQPALQAKRAASGNGSGAEVPA
ncbi:MAG TPA: nitrite/sulfite reductase [Patescibacteria group bacterium]|nr:nitrite/sulfite reductase [Patescibacteria group bacterium]